MPDYPTFETFYTIQGEGFWTGTPAFFIRLAGCEVGCTWCDIRESWPLDGFPLKSAAQLAEIASDSAAERVVITGGEPCMYDLNDLTRALHDKGLKIHLETSAAWPVKGTFDWICISPKKFKIPLEAELHRADELKVVVFNKSDFKWGEEYAAKVRTDCLLYLQPEWDRAAVMLPDIIDYIKQHPRWRISLQTHKYMDIP
jgi:7-carboxy-7-deazaguanine synthase